MSISEIILLTAAIVAATGVIITALARTRTVLRKMDRLAVLLAEMNTQLGGTPNAFEILQQIIAEFRTDSGSSLKDQINTMEHAIAGLTRVARTNEVAAEVLKSQVETVRELASIERRQSSADRAQMIRVLGALEGTGVRGLAIAERVETEQKQVADDLAEHRAANDEGRDSVP